MEAFSILEAKLVTFIKAFKELQEENLILKAHVEQLQNSLLSKDMNASELSQQNELTEMALADLIKSLDFLDSADSKVECEK